MSAAPATPLTWESIVRPPAHYEREGRASARACARSYGITDPAEIAHLAKQFAYDARGHDERHALALGLSAPVAA